LGHKSIEVAARIRIPSGVRSGLDLICQSFYENRDALEPRISTERRVSMGSLSEHRSFRSPARGSDAAERGSSLIGLLIVLVILGLMAAATLGGLGYTSNPAITGVPLTMPGGGAIVATTSTTVLTPNPNDHPSTTTIATCRADYATVSSAVQSYERHNGVLPPAGTAWAHLTVKGVPLLRVWQRDKHNYVIEWNGSTLSVVPAKGVTAHGSAGTSSPPTGCFAA